MNNTIVDKTYLAEVLVTGGSTKQQILFPTLQNLDEKLTQAVVSFTIDVVTVSPTGVDVVNNALLQCSYLTLVMGDVNQIWNIPIVSLCTVNTGTSIFNPYALEFNNLNIIWAKSYVFIADLATIAVTDETFIFDIHYQDFPTANENK